MNKIFKNHKFILLFLFYLLLPDKAYAYLDPGTGSIIVYTLVAFVTSLISFSKKLINYLSKIFSKIYTNKNTKDYLLNSIIVSTPFVHFISINLSNLEVVSIFQLLTFNLVLVFLLVIPFFLEKFFNIKHLTIIISLLFFSLFQFKLSRLLINFFLDSQSIYDEIFAIIICFVLFLLVTYIYLKKRRLIVIFYLTLIIVFTSNIIINYKSLNFVKLLPKQEIPSIIKKNNIYYVVNDMMISINEFKFFFGYIPESFKILEQNGGYYVYGTQSLETNTNTLSLILNNTKNLNDVKNFYPFVAGGKNNFTKYLNQNDYIFKIISSRFNSCKKALDLSYSCIDKKNDFFKIDLFTLSSFLEYTPFNRIIDKFFINLSRAINLKNDNPIIIDLFIKYFKKEYVLENNFFMIYDHNPHPPYFYLGKRLCV